MRFTYPVLLSACFLAGVLIGSLPLVASSAFLLGLHAPRFLSGD